MINNMQVLHECKDSGDDHMQTRSRERPCARGGDVFNDVEGPGNELEEWDMTEILDHLSEIDKFSSRRVETMNQERDECLKELENAKWYDNSTVHGSHEEGDNEDLMLPDDDTLEAGWKDEYERRKAAWKDEAVKVQSAEMAVGEVFMNRFDDVEMVDILDEDPVKTVGDLQGSGDPDDGELVLEKGGH